MLVYLMSLEKKPGFGGGSSSTMARMRLLGVVVGRLGGVLGLDLNPDLDLAVVFVLGVAFVFVLGWAFLVRNGGFMVISLELV